MSRIIPALSRDLERSQRRHKYGAEPTVVDGIRFDSTREANRYRVLKLAQGAGEVRLILRQVALEIAPAIYDEHGKQTARRQVYRADFVVWWRDGRLTVEDAKGYRTQEYLRKRRRVEALYGITIEEV